MRNKIKKSFQKIRFEIVFPLILIFLVGFLSWKNFTPGTFLTGWDTLHPEFNLTHAFTSVMNGVWRSDQGLGAIAGHSHMSEFPRLVYLAVARLVLPLSALRYSFFFLCLALGPVGVYFFVKKLAPSKNTQVVSLTAFLSASFYLLNLTVLQHFYVPFEMFATQYAALPWLFLFSWSYLKTGKYQSLAFFAIASFLSTPQAYAATLFYAWSIVCFAFLITFLLIHKISKVALKRVLFVGLTLVATNAFWALPNIYSITNQSAEIQESSINQIFSTEAFLHNKAYGDIPDVLIGKSFLFHWQEFSFKDNKFTDLLNEWSDHLAKPYVTTLFYLFSLASFIGLVIALIKRDTFAWVSLPGLFIALFFLINENSPTGALYSFMRGQSSLIEEGFRMPFTKFSIIFLLLNSVYLAHFFASVLRLYKNNLITKSIRVTLSILVFSTLVYMVYPMFTGSLISPSMRVATPSQYFQAFEWFKGHNGRVAQLPLNSMWGWQYNNWGYQGAGFFWFGIDNPFLTRDFDRWNAANETFFIQASTAFASGKDEVFDATLKKYNVRYLVYDESIINAGTTDPVPNPQGIELLAKRYKEVAAFDFLKIYETPYGVDSVSVVPTYIKTTSDETYSSVVSTNQTIQSPTGISYPFANTDTRTGVVPSFTDEVTIVGQKVPSGGYYISIPHFVDEESYLPVKISVVSGKNAVMVRLDLVTPEIRVDGITVAQDPVYMQYSLKTRGEVPGYLSLNGQIFDLSESSNGVIGTAVVPRDGKTTLSLFGRQGDVNTTYGDGIGLRQASFCSVDSQKVETQKVDLGFAVPVFEDSVCLGDSFAVQANSIVSVSYKIEGPLSPYFCVNQAGVDGCINKTFPKTVRDKTYKSEVVLSQGSYWFAFVAQSQPKPSVVTYRDIQVQTAKELSSVPIFFGDALREFVRGTTIPVSVNNSISVVYRVPPILSEDWALSRGHSLAYNCDLHNRGTVDKTTLLTGIEYKAADEGVSCDYFDYRALAPNRSYLIRLIGENTTGRSMKLYLTNSQSNRVDFEKLLSSGSFDNTYVVHPVGESSKGYVANIETRSFGSVSSENKIMGLAWYYLPYEWMKDLMLTPVNYQPQGGSVDIKEQASYGLVTYVTVSSPTGGIIELNQAYESGWVAFANGRTLPHTKVDGWANGWSVPDGESFVTIVFLPQILEYLGLVIFLGSGVFLLHKSL